MRTGIEPSNLFSFTGGEETNGFTIQLMQNLANYSGKPGHLRIGGNTQDYFLYRDDMNDFIVQQNPNSVGQGAVASDAFIIGPRYFEALSRFPRGSPVTFGLNLAYYQADYLDQITAMAQAAVSKLTALDLVSFEIGNEPDLYLSNRFRNGTWTGQTYVQEWTTRAREVYTRVLQPAGRSVALFEGPCAASTIGTTFEVSQLVNNGLQAASHVDGPNGSLPYLRAWNQHDYLYYIGVSGSPLTIDWLMNLDNTESQFAYWATQIGIALDETGLPYHLREMASVGPIGLAGVSDTFGAALWTLNFFLYAATLNISSVQMHMTDNSFAAPWQPTDRDRVPKYVRPSYYAFAAMAQLIGSGNGTTQVAPLLPLPLPPPAPLPMPPAYKSNVRMYAAYGGAGGGLTSITIINARPVNASETNKPSLAVSLSLPVVAAAASSSSSSSFKGQTLYLSYLTADGADATNGTVWNGLQYSNNDGTPLPVATADTAAAAGQQPETVVVGDDGTAIINVRDSQAVIAYIGARLGSNQVIFNGSVPQAGGSGQPPARTSAASSTMTGAAPTPTSSSKSTGDKITSYKRESLVLVTLALCAYALVIG